MKRWIPYLVALLIPIMIFISFFWMIKKRTFIFREDFIYKGKTLSEETGLLFTKVLEKDILEKYTSLEAFLLSDKQSENNLFLKNLVQQSTILENILIMKDKQVIQSYQPVSQEKINDYQWAVSNQAHLSQEIKFFSSADRLIAYKDFQDKKIFLITNPGLFYQILVSKYPFLKNNLVINNKNIGFNISKEYYQKQNTFIQKAESVLEGGKKIIMEINGDYLFCNKFYLLRQNQIVWDFNLFFYLDTDRFPMNIWHRIILVLTGVIIVSMLLMLLFKIKNEMDLEKIRDYKEGNDFWENNLIVHSVEDEESKESVEEDFMEIPDEYFEKKNYGTEKKHPELTEMIDKVNEHEMEIQEFNSLWKNVNKLIKRTNDKAALFLLNKDTDEFIMHYQKNLLPESNITLSVENWIIKNYILKNLSLLVTSQAMEAQPIKQIFVSEDFNDTESVFIAPINRPGEGFQGVFLLISDKNLEEKEVSEINNLLQMG